MDRREGFPFADKILNASKKILSVFQLLKSWSNPGIGGKFSYFWNAAQLDVKISSIIGKTINIWPRKLIQ